MEELTSEELFMLYEKAVGRFQYWEQEVRRLQQLVEVAEAAEGEAE